MTDAPLCALCGRPVIDMAYVCDRCAAKTRTELERVALVAGEAMTTIAKQARIGTPGRRTDPEMPLPVNREAAADHDAAVSTLVTWARHVHEESGRTLPSLRALPCRHPSCLRIRQGRTDGPLCPIAVPEHPTAVMATWLVRQVDWIRHRPEAVQALDEIDDACRVLVRVVDRPAERLVVGQCACGTYLYATAKADDVTCAQCGTTYGVQASRDMLREQLDEMLFTAAEIAVLAQFLGLTERRDAARKLINQWAVRGHMVVHDYLGEPAYRFGEVIDRLVAAKLAS